MVEIIKDSPYAGKMARTQCQHCKAELAYHFSDMSRELRDIGGLGGSFARYDYFYYIRCPYCGFQIDVNPEVFTETE